MDKQYKALKPITAAAIYKAGDKDCEEFRNEFDIFLYWNFKRFSDRFSNPQFYFFCSISIRSLQSQFLEHPNWKRFLIDKAFIGEVIPEKTYSVTDEFRSNLAPYAQLRLILIGPKKVAFLSLDKKMYLNICPLTVKDPNKISENEFSVLAGNQSSMYTKIEDKDSYTLHVSDINSKLEEKP